MKTIKQNWAIRFIPLWVGQALSLLGSQLVHFAIIWFLTQETKSATTLAIASMMGLLPQVLLSPFIGTWVDRGNRRLILIAALVIAIGYVWLRGGFVGVMDMSAQSAPPAAAALRVSVSSRSRRLRSNFR